LVKREGTSRPSSERASTTSGYNSAKTSGETLRFTITTASPITEVYDTHEWTFTLTVPTDRDPISNDDFEVDWLHIVRAERHYPQDVEMARSTPELLA